MGFFRPVPLTKVILPIAYCLISIFHQKTSMKSQVGAAPSRSVYYSIRHRIYCKGNANSPYVAFLTSSTRADSKSLAESFGTTIEQSSLVVIGDDVERTYPLRLSALEISPDETQTVQAAVAIVGATMSELQTAKRVELRGEMLSRNLMNIAFWLSFDLAGDRRKIGIASRSCVR